VQTPIPKFLKTKFGKGSGGNIQVNTVISSSGADEKIVKAMDKIQDFVSKIYKNSLKQTSFESYFKKQ
jgi:hypothetical protein